MHNSYKIAIIYFILFSILLLISALMLFATKIGFSFVNITNYYLGNQELFMRAKSFSGLLKVIYPHIFSITLFGMVILHFIYFTSFAKTKLFKYLIILTYLSIFLEILSSFFIIFGAEFFSSIKLISFILMFILFLYSFWILLHSILIQKSQNF